MQSQQAEEHLRVIRSLMEKATIYRAISAPTALVGGLASLVAAGWLYFGHTRPDNRPDFMPAKIWFLVLLITITANALFIWKEAKQRQEPFISPGMKMALMSLLPSHLVAAFLTLGNLPHDELLAEVWVLFHGLGLLATGHFAPSSIKRLGWAFLIAGLVIFFGNWLNTSEIVSSPPLVMAATFGGFHLVYAVCTWPRGAKN